jgi:hypothetical protein
MKDVTGIDISITNDKIDDVQTDITTIDSKIDNLQSDTTIIKSDSAKTKENTNKISEVEVGGLGDKQDSLAYRVAENERHNHSYARWYGKAITPNGEIHVADELGYDAGAFQLNAGNNDFGAWVQVMGSSDTPFAPGQVYFDFDEFQIENTQRTNTYVLQISFGETGDQGIASKTYSTKPYTPQTNQVDSDSITIKSKRHIAGTKVWVRCKCITQISGTINLYIGFHEYEG